MLTATCRECKTCCRSLPEHLSRRRLRCKRCHGPLEVYPTPGTEVPDPEARDREVDMLAPATATAPGEAQSPPAPDAERYKEIRAPAFEVEAVDGTSALYVGDEGIARLRAAILEGKIAKGSRGRRLSPPGNEGGPVEAGPWETLACLSRQDARLRVLYQPIWTRTMAGLGIGAGVGILLKLLDSSWFFYNLDSRVFGFWLLALGAIYASRWFGPATFLLLFICVKEGVAIWGLFSAIFTSMVVGALFGAPAGMAVGTLVGYFKRGGDKTAPDAEEEGFGTCFWGLLAPAFTFAALLSFWIFWLTPAIIERLLKS